MTDWLYAPPTNLSDRNDIEGEIAFINGMIMSLDPNDPQFLEQEGYYYGHLNDLQEQLHLCDTKNNAPSYPTPGGSSSSNSELAFDSCKRERDPPAPLYSLPPLPVRSQQPEVDNSRLHYPPQGSNYVDLTGDDFFTSDPFAELQNAYQPSMEPPPQAFNQNYMDTQQLARFLTSPAYPRVQLPSLTAAPPPTQSYGQTTYSNLDQLQPGAYQSYPEEPSSFPWPGSRGYADQDDFFDQHVNARDEPEAVQHLIDNIQFDHEVQPGQREPTPKSMQSTLMEHQKIALTWLLKMELSNAKGGILADEMGLGKTVQALALILANPSGDPLRKTTLIVAPVALMRQWEKEIERHVKPHHRLKVFIYHGPTGKKATWDILRTYDIVLTTFGTMASELAQKDDRAKQEDAQREQQEAPNKRRRGNQPLSLLGRECMWYRVILDEAQCIKNRATLTSRAANDLQSQYRLAMTGTPMMNSVDELFSLIRFLKIPPYHQWNKFSQDISRPLKRQDFTRDRAMQRVQALIKSIMLRRCKTTIVDGKEICQIPPKETIPQNVEFSSEERSLYNAVETKSQIQFNKYLAKGAVNNNYANVLVMLLRLRQMCCHPHLVKDLAVQASTENISAEELKERASMLPAWVVKRLHDVSREGFECPICYETEMNPTIFIPCGHTCCGDCFQKLIDPARAIREGMESNKAKCPECREILSSDRITDFVHFCMVHYPDLLGELAPEEGKFGIKNESDNDSGDDSDSDDTSDDEDAGDDVDNKGNLKNFVVDTTDDDEDYIKSSSSNDESKTTSKPVKNIRKDKGKGKAKAKVTLAQLKKDSLRSKSAKRKYLKRLRKTFETSAKIEKTMELLSEIRANDPTEKTLIFSQFTSLLDLLEVPLQEKRVTYQRYDGSMTMNDRAEAVNSFMDDPNETVFLISLKAGNAGLNLNKASQVIMLDPFWNPFVEDQAVDRAHRMPQRREVKVHRILVPDTVEDRICALQEKKRDLINTAMDEGVGKQLTRLSVGELKYLFGLGR